MGEVRVGVGGWDYEPWRETFYPPKLPKTRQLGHAASKLTAIEINGTYYSAQKPETWRKWRDSVPDGFRFTVKASRFCTTRRVLAEGAESIARFLAQGFTELGDKLGPILWQFMATKKYDREDFAGFLKLLPDAQDGVPLRHAIEVRHESFAEPAFLDLLRDRNIAIVFTDVDDRPRFAEATADFAYARLQASRAEEETGYASAELNRIAVQARDWAAGGDAYIFFISGAKERNPAAAMALIERLRA